MKDASRALSKSRDNDVGSHPVTEKVTSKGSKASSKLDASTLDILKKISDIAEKFSAEEINNVLGITLETLKASLSRKEDLLSKFRKSSNKNSDMVVKAKAKAFAESLIDTVQDDRDQLEAMKEDFINILVKTPSIKDFQKSPFVSVHALGVETIMKLWIKELKN